MSQALLVTSQLNQNVRDKRTTGAFVKVAASGGAWAIRRSSIGLDGHLLVSMARPTR
jgi:hypothetical protein